MSILQSLFFWKYKLLIFATMRTSFFHKIIALTLVLSLALPLWIGFSHVMENEEHNVCASLNENHVHTEKIYCSNLHYFTVIQYQDHPFYFTSLLPDFIYYNPVFVKSFHFLSVTSSFLVRGPPAINVF